MVLVLPMLQRSAAIISACIFVGFLWFSSHSYFSVQSHTFAAHPKSKFHVSSVFELGTGPWFSPSNNTNWAVDTRCNPYSGNCDCLKKTWNLDVCKMVGQTPVTLSVEGWLTEWPNQPGMHRCRVSFCNIVHGPAPNISYDAKLFSIIDANNEKHYTTDTIMVGVALESRPNRQVHALPTFKYFFHLGVSYARGHLDLHTSYNNYFPGQLLSTGAPFKARKDSLLFLHSNCNNNINRTKLFDQLSKLLKLDSPGSCRHNVDVATLLPQCVDFPHSGKTVWAQKECLLHHYKFYLAIENSRDIDYVTEKLWQGLRAGSVPVYLGAPNIRDFLPHPDAAVLIDDFSSLAELAAYIKNASINETLYNRHLKWKREPLPDRFVELVVKKPIDAIYCQVCDTISQRYGHDLGPISVSRNKTITLPPCIFHSLANLRHPIVRNWVGPQYSTHNNINIYVLTVQTAQARQKFMKLQLASQNVSVDLVTGFDVNDTTVDTFACWAPRSTLDPRPQHTTRHIGSSELSLAMKHSLAAWDMLRQERNVSIVLEDDASLHSNFVQHAVKAMAEAPPNWDLIILGTCFGLRASSTSQRVSTLLWRAPAKSPTRCTHALMWSRAGAKKMLQSLPLRWPIDFQINMATNLAKWQVFWLEPPQSTQSSAFKSMLGL